MRETPMLMGGADSRFWMFFGGVWLLVGTAWLLGALAALVFFGGAGKPPALLAAFAGVGLVLGAAGGTLVTLAWRAMARERRLKAAGLRLAAKVVEIRPGKVRINREPRWILRYRYGYAGGEEHEGESAPLSADEARKWQPGESGAIMVDPRDPRRSLWLGER
jgi:hypothetical protein